MIKRIRSWSMKMQLFWVILLSAALCLALFGFNWAQKVRVYNLVQKIPAFGWNEEDFLKKLRKEAHKTVLPKSEDDKEAIEKMEPFFSLRDQYTSVYVYSLDDGNYLAGSYASMMDDPVRRTFFDTAYALSRVGEALHREKMEFLNGSAQVFVYSYHISRIVYPYLFFCIFISFLFFWILVLGFVGRKMRKIGILKEAILVMAGGNLNCQVPSMGGDEIGVLAAELDNLRLALDKSIAQKEESHRANQDLITAMSHDLRTPLTVLNGYLEILKRRLEDERMREEYVQRCLTKVSDIRAMTDKMFEYALVYEGDEDIHKEVVSVGILREMLVENCDFICLTGFVTKVSLEECQGEVQGDLSLLKRVFNNLFSNIIKYGDKKEPVEVSWKVSAKEMRIILKNKVKENQDFIESNHIGLKSSEKMTQLHGGSLTARDCQGFYQVELCLPLWGIR